MKRADVGTPSVARRNISSSVMHEYGSDGELWEVIPPTRVRALTPHHPPSSAVTAEQHPGGCCRIRSQPHRSTRCRRERRTARRVRRQSVPSGLTCPIVLNAGGLYKYTNTRCAASLSSRRWARILLHGE